MYDRFYNIIDNILYYFSGNNGGLVMLIIWSGIAILLIWDFVLFINEIRYELKEGEED